MSDSIASPPLGHSACHFGSGETDCHSGLWWSLSREGGRNREERKKAGEGEKIDQIIYSVPYIWALPVSPLHPSLSFLPPTHFYRHSSPLVSSPLTPEQAYVKFVPLVVGSCPCYSFNRSQGALAFPTAPPGSVLQVIASWRVQRMEECPREYTWVWKSIQEIHKRMQEYLRIYKSMQEYPREYTNVRKSIWQSMQEYPRECRSCFRPWGHSM